LAVASDSELWDIIERWLAATEGSKEALSMARKTTKQLDFADADSGISKQARNAAGELENDRKLIEVSDPSRCVATLMNSDDQRERRKSIQK
jgi:hypothetical protein